MSQLLSLLLVLDDKGVQVAGAAKLELDIVRVLLDAGGFKKLQLGKCKNGRLRMRCKCLHLASLRRAISRNSLMSLICLG